MSYAKSLLDGTHTGAHLSPSQGDCERSAGQLRPRGLGGTCPVVWDGLLCWPPTMGGATIQQPCPAVHSFNTQQYAFRHCLPNGTWFGATGPHQSSGWSNYSLCVPSTPTARAIFTSGSYVTATGYDAALDGHFTAASSVEKTEVTRVLTGTSSDVTLPLDDVIGTGVHSVSALCLLFALVTWVTLRLTDRLLTRRYLILIGTILSSFLFHIIVLTSRLRAVTSALSTPHPSPGPLLHPPPSPLRAHHSPSAETFLLPHQPRFPPRSEHPVSSEKLLGTSPAPRRAARLVHNAEKSDVRRHKRLVAGPSSLRAQEDKEQTGSLAVERTAPPPNSLAHLAAPTSVAHQRMTPPNSLAHLARMAPPNTFTHQRMAAHSRYKDGFGLLDGFQDKVWTERARPVIRRRRQLEYGVVHGGKERGEGSGQKKGDLGGSSASQSGPLVTVCQVGRAFYLLTDVSVYAFLFALCLYYTLVVLGKALTFTKLLTLFLCGVGVPVVFLTFTVLLYALLPTRHPFGSSCAVDSLGDEFHWATTAPKLVCLVLALCLMSVSTYGFWRLHVPALHASTETFYARQGVLKSLALLLILSLAELFHLVTQYQGMYEDGGMLRSPAVLHASTAASGAKGAALALLLCFLDGEMLHGTCCAPLGSSRNGEPWLRTAPGPAAARHCPGREDKSPHGVCEDGGRRLLNPASPAPAASRAVADSSNRRVPGSLVLGDKV